MLEITYIGEHTCTRDLHNSSTVADVVADSNATTTTNHNDHNDQNAPPFLSPYSSSSAYSSKEASPLTFPVLPDIAGFDAVVPVAQLASFASEELLEVDDILIGFDDQFGLF